MQKKTSILALSLLCAGALALTGCSGVKEQLGLTKDSPDEFSVLKRAPLEMPPGMALPPPTPGAPRPQEQTPDAQAQQTVFGSTDAPSSASPGAAEEALLQQAGAGNNDPDIRAIVDKETAELHDRNKPVAEKLLGIGGDKNEPSASVVDAQKEYERLKKNKEEGKPATEGETPSIEE